MKKGLVSKFTALILGLSISITGISVTAEQDSNKLENEKINAEFKEMKEMNKKIKSGNLEPIPDATVILKDSKGNELWKGTAKEYKKNTKEIREKAFGKQNKEKIKKEQKTDLPK
ncbi:hypothetical protein BN1058_00843 [Paraliobacillus sp. PM-2]|uniref:hypothetical protein n=1 Tax=Paraliobacillus sp. PM-2 TaxID=1462524 RepID=UPI00061BA284|nr:hypothetical protein [Paraliobacillus sp. PM-2]CQR46576.1 hypothetical protein BN1058_00843 [Paraliobacillus sp. PM-2]